ncbi:hypothetical protein C8F01DRAFT_1094629 [Mycena amicta]|nr:hypothetical protein C8F01DRAFT_1094629 [Mycena amicta]
MNDRTEQESDAGARAKLGRLGAARRVRTEPSLARKATTVSWIWFLGATLTLGRYMTLSVYSGRKHWPDVIDGGEEVLILPRGGQTSIARSGQHAGYMAGTSKHAPGGRARARVRSSGIRLRQVAVHKRIVDTFYKSWNVSAAEAVRSVVAQDVSVATTGE